MEAGRDEGKMAVATDLIQRARARLGARPVILIGLMGAGKSSIGKRLALRLDMPFADADQEIEKAAGKTITDIFDEDVEAVFRSGECRVIARLLEGSAKVLATGGGAFMNKETRDRIAAKGVSVWLKADLGILLQRVARRDNRPLLKIGDPRAVMEKLINERYPVYALADITIDSRDIAHEVVVDEIVAALAACSKLPAAS
jgi:shikimate kinase